VSLTWEEVRARSEARTTSGMSVYCGDCGMVFPRSGLPCREHATPEESKAIDEFMSRALASLPTFPRTRP
jgi:hypothetical protein